MKTFLYLGLSVGAALSLSLPVSGAPGGGGGPAGFAVASGGSGGSGHGGGGAGGGSHAGVVSHGGGSGSHSGGGSFGFHESGVAHAAGSFHAPVAVRSQAALFVSGQRAWMEPRRALASTVPGVLRTPTFAFGGHPGEARIAERSNGRFTRPNGGWDRNWDRIWHGRHFHWNNGAWVVINDGYYPYGDSYYAPASPDVYPDMSYDYGDNNSPGSYAPGVVPAPMAIPADPEASIAADVQQSLATLGYYHGEIDGIVNDLTRSAIADFQKANDLPITGYITKSLLNALGLLQPQRGGPAN